MTGRRTAALAITCVALLVTWPVVLVRALIVVVLAGGAVLVLAMVTEWARQTIAWRRLRRTRPAPSVPVLPPLQPARPVRARHRGAS